MKPFRTLAETTTAEGGHLKLHEHDGDFFILLNGQQLMSSRANASEIELARVACRSLEGKPGPRILVGGLGMGFTLTAVLELVGPDAMVETVELMPEVVAWNREYLRSLNGTALDDERVEILVEDVFAVLHRAPANPYDVIIMDVDNGPVAFVLEKNRRLYHDRGVELMVNALKPDGCLAVWSAEKDRPFADRLYKAGLKVDVIGAKAHANARRDSHVIFVGCMRPQPKSDRVSR
ncbi:MAG: spermine synthase [Verrucomicrobia bacterium]|nr:MAG: spermine synthase [Verrucomicrobiota bacterium]